MQGDREPLGIPQLRLVMRFGSTYLGYETYQRQEVQRFTKTDNLDFNLLW
jgi:hypothetical protein